LSGIFAGWNRFIDWALGIGHWALGEAKRRDWA